MRFQHLGKTQKVKVLTAKLRIIHIVCTCFALMSSFLAYAWQVIPLPYWATLSIFLASALFVGKVSEVPFSKEILFTKLKGRVSFDP